MTRDEFKVLVKGMKAVYTEPSFIPDQNAFDVWYEMLKDLDYNLASNAIKKHMMNNEKVPKVSHIRQEATNFKKDKPEELNEMAAWRLIQIALRRCGTYERAQEEFDKLPPVVQKSIVSPSQLKEWATMEDIDGRALNVMQSNFMRTFRVEQERQKEKDKLSPDLVKLINSPADTTKVAKKEFGTLSVAEERELLFKGAIPAPKGLLESVKSFFANND